MTYFVQIECDARFDNTCHSIRRHEIPIAKSGDSSILIPALIRTARSRGWKKSRNKWMCPLCYAKREKGDE